MRLRKLEVKGFKSFRDKTSLEFPRQFTGIIGPNGSGKSNTTEAVCFVLGQSRGLRANSLQDLIFNGGVGGKPASKAVVSLTVEDDDSRRRKITRIIDRDGHSQYKIDDKRSTRENVISLLGDNEYNIILQDDVTKVINMKPVERRALIDDLCGIREYDEKKGKSLRELEKVEDRISNTHLVLGEKQNYLKELSKERTEAMDYQTTRDLLQKTRATILFKDLESASRRKEKLESLSVEDKREKESLEKSIVDAEREIQEKTGQIRNINSEIQGFHGAHGQVRVAEVHGEYLRVKDKIDNLIKERDKLNEDIKSASSRKSEISEQLRDIENKEMGFSEKQSVLSSKLKKYAGSGGTGLVDEERELRNNLSEFKSELKSVESSGVEQDKEFITLDKDKTELEKKFKEVVGEFSRSEAEISKLQSEYDDLVGKFQVVESKNNDAKTRVDELRLRLEEKKLEHERKKTEFETLQRTGHSKASINAVLKLQKVLPGVKGPAYQLGQVKEGEFSLAIQVAAGSRMQYIVTDNVDTTTKCIKYLREKQVGRAAFIPLEKIKARTSKKKPSGCLGFARDFIDCKSQYKSVFDYIFGDTVIVQDIDAAKKIGVGNYRMVTLEGDLLELSGVITGGFTKIKREIGFKDIEKLESDIVRLVHDISRINQDLEDSLTKSSQVESDTRSKRNEITGMKSQLDSLKTNKRILLDRKDSIKSNLDKTSKRLVEVEESINLGKQSAIQWKKKISALEKDLDNLVSKFQGGDTSKAQQLSNEIKDVEVERAKILENKRYLDEELNEKTKTVQKLKEEVTRVSGEISSLEKSAGDLSKTVDRMQAENQQVSEKISELEENREACEKALTGLSARLTINQKRLVEVTNNINNYLVEEAKINTRVEDLERDYKRYEGVEILDESAKSLSESVEKLEAKIQEFGSVNLRAIESYDSVKKEYDDLTEKLDVLKKERSSIYEFMDKIEQKKTKSFMEAFDGVKDNFEDIYARLSDGHGTLVLTNPANISESGLNIKASPKGKNVLSLKALSGGEKAVTSAAFLLAVQRYKPSYFYIIDELDAALDNANSQRLAQMLAESKTQFILVTHNKEMMRYINSAIGVTMIDGVSQIVGVEIPDASN